MFYSNVLNEIFICTIVIEIEQKKFNHLVCYFSNKSFIKILLFVVVVNALLNTCSLTVLLLQIIIIKVVKVW